jgi:hypothetical protein
VVRLLGLQLDRDIDITEAVSIGSKVAAQQNDFCNLREKTLISVDLVHSLEQLRQCILGSPSPYRFRSRRGAERLRHLGCSPNADASACHRDRKSSVDQRSDDRLGFGAVSSEDHLKGFSIPAEQGSTIGAQAS